MSSPPAVLLLDDGELDRFAAVLRSLGVEYTHLRGRQIGHMVEKPTDLLITSLNRAVKLPDFETSRDSQAPEPIRICAHQQDFLPLRERLRKLGIHFLIHSQIDPETLRLLFLQLLHQGAEQRGAYRVPFGCEVGFWADGGHHIALLAELALDSCRLVTTDSVRDGTQIRLQLPRALSQHGSIELQGTTLRCTQCELSQDANGFNVAVEFDHRASDTQAALEEILSGRQLGTRVTPLSPVPGLQKPDDSDFGATGEFGEELPEITLDRRREERRSYNREVAALSAMNADAPQVVLGRDLSLSGVRIARHPALQVGSGLALAIYGHEGSTPLVVEAEVVNDQGEDGLGLRFLRVTQETRRRLQEVIDELPELESLDNDSTQPDRVFVSKILPNAD